MLNSIGVYLAPFLVFGLVVFVHELGHFLAAKLTGVYAPVFSLGWGSRLFGWRKGETDYRVSWFPIGGYVRMATREDDSMAGIEGGKNRGDLDTPAEAPPAPGALWDENSMAPFGPKAVPENRWVESKGTLARVFILSAGVMMNIVLAVVVSSGVIYKYGMEYRPAIIDSLMTGSPAVTAGVAPGDEIVTVNGERMKGWNEVVDRIAPVTSGSLTLGVKRGVDTLSLSVTPEPAEITNPETGTKRRVGRVGIYVKDTVVREQVSFGEAITTGARASWFMATNVGTVLWGLVTGNLSVSQLGGPVAIAKTSVQAARNGAEMLWSLIAFLSLNIAILNLVPIPVLDGGQILLVVAERIKGSPFGPRFRENFARVGVIAVLMLLVLVFYNDLVRPFFTK